MRRGIHRPGRHRAEYRAIAMARRCTFYLLSMGMLAVAW